MTGSWRLMAAAALLVAGMATGAQSADATSDRPDLPIEGTITNPDWIQKPGPEDFSDHYPKPAWALGVSGVVTITCTVVATGALADCTTSDETPKGFGFAAAALQISQYFRMKPKTVDGVPVTGGRFTTRIRFNMPEDSTPAPDAEPAGPAPTPSALALGRQLVAANNDQQGIDSAMNYYVGQLEAEAGPDATSDEFQTVLSALKASLHARLAAETEGLALYYAQTFSEDDMRQLIAFAQSSAGRSWAAHQRERSAAYTRVMTQALRTSVQEVRKQVCDQADCAKAAAPSPPVAK
jgi:TonB family protein